MFRRERAGGELAGSERSPVATARQFAEAEEDFLAGENHSGSHRNICQVVFLSRFYLSCRAL
jgi:ABC-type branched-subunit amino acid transport system ATPase component